MTLSLFDCLLLLVVILLLYVLIALQKDRHERKGGLVLRNWNREPYGSLGSWKNFPPKKDGSW